VESRLLSPRNKRGYADGAYRFCRVTFFFKRLELREVTVEDSNGGGPDGKGGIPTSGDVEHPYNTTRGNVFSNQLTNQSAKVLFNQAINQSTRQPKYHSINQSTNQPV
jgi:hypothetical protein